MVAHLFICVHVPVTSPVIAESIKTFDKLLLIIIGGISAAVVIILVIVIITVNRHHKKKNKQLAKELHKKE